MSVYRDRFRRQMAQDIEVVRARQSAGGRANRGKKRDTQSEKDEIAAYLARNPEPFRST